MIRIYKDFHFDAAHWLPRVPDGHKCGRIHGHTYRLRVWCSGELDDRGFVMDYAEIADSVSFILAAIDHRLLNEIPGLVNPTTEILAKWFYDRLKPHLPQLSGIEVAESSTTGCVYDGPAR